MNESTKSGRDPLDEALASLPEDVRPERDLWPQIRAEIAKTPIVAPASARARSRRGFGSQQQCCSCSPLRSLLTIVTRQSMQPQVAQTAPKPVPAPQVTGAARELQLRVGASGRRLRERARRARQALPGAHRHAAGGRSRQSREEPCGPAPRRGRDFRDARQHPSDPLLQDLLMSTYQSELQLLANVSDLPTAGSMRTDL